MKRFNLNKEDGPWLVKHHFLLSDGATGSNLFVVALPNLGHLQYSLTCNYQVPVAAGLGGHGPEQTTFWRGEKW
jgi:hypothetical protein